MKLSFYFLILSLSLFASENGEKVYEKHCSKCHIKESVSQAQTVKRMGNLKAPPFIEVSNRLKEQIVIKSGDEDIHREVVIAFIKHYIQNPDMMIGMCNPGAFERFGEMPSLKAKLTDQEMQTVAEWLYDNYEGEKFE
jgi:mono/diheme cytochrome c family protein